MKFILSSVVPFMNHIGYPLLRRWGIRWGAISRMTFGFALCTIGSIGFIILQVFLLSLRFQR
jgi:hypothetical protein